MALAAMDREPVAWVMLEDLADKDIVSTPAYPDINDAMEMTHGELEPLYRHAQQPVVLDGLIKAVEFYEQVKRENPPVETGAWKDAVDWVLKEACRAAMLAAAPQPQNAPQNIPEIIPGWIPVSERMPEDRMSVILWDAEIGEVTSGHYSHKTQTFYHCGDAIGNEITHWMPLPAAPQEVKGE